MTIKSAFATLTPMKRILAGVAFTLAGAFNAYAHVPAEGSEQHNLLKPFNDFIMHMKKSDGTSSCCSLNDGRGDLEERMTKDGKYEVKITHDLAGTKLAAPKWIKVPDEAVLSARHANAICKPLRAANADSTCKSPPFNVIWYRDDGHIYCYFPRPQIM